MKTQQHTSDAVRPNPALHALVQDWNTGDKGRKHEAFESGSSERRSLARVLRMDRKR